MVYEHFHFTLKSSHFQQTMRQFRRIMKYILSDPGGDGSDINVEIIIKTKGLNEDEKMQ